MSCWVVPSLMFRSESCTGPGSPFFDQLEKSAKSFIVVSGCFYVAP